MGIVQYMGGTDAYYRISSKSHRGKILLHDPIWWGNNSRIRAVRAASTEIDMHTRTQFQ